MKVKTTVCAHVGGIPIEIEVCVEVHHEPKTYDSPGITEAQSILWCDVKSFCCDGDMSEVIRGYDWDDGLVSLCKKAFEQAEEMVSSGEHEEDPSVFARGRVA